MPDFLRDGVFGCGALRLVLARRTAACACACLLTAAAFAEPLVDPTAPARLPARATAADAATVSAPVRPPLQLQGVWQRGADRVATVNGARVRAGDRVDGRRVLAVLDDGVQVREEDGRTETLRLQPRVRARASELLPAGDGELAVRR